MTNLHILYTQLHTQVHQRDVRTSCLHSLPQGLQEMALTAITHIHHRPLTTQQQQQQHTTRQAKTKCDNSCNTSMSKLHTYTHNQYLGTRVCKATFVCSLGQEKYSILGKPKYSMSPKKLDRSNVTHKVTLLFSYFKVTLKVTGKLLQSCLRVTYPWLQRQHEKVT